MGEVKDRCYGGPGLWELRIMRRKATLAWLNSLRRNHR